MEKWKTKNIIRVFYNVVFILRRVFIQDTLVFFFFN